MFFSSSTELQSRSQSHASSLGLIDSCEKKEGFNCAALRPSTVHALLCRFFLAQASTLLCTYARSGAQTRHTQSERTLVPSLCRIECRYLCEYNVHPSEGTLPSSPQRQGGPGDTALRANWTPRLCAVRCALISVLNLSCEVFLLPPHAHEDARRQKIPTKKKCSFRRETHACKQLFFFPLRSQARSRSVARCAASRTHFLLEARVRKSYVPAPHPHPSFLPILILPFFLVSIPRLSTRGYHRGSLSSTPHRIATRASLRGHPLAS